MKSMDAIETTLNGAGIVFGIANIQEVLGVVLLVLNILLIVIRFVLRLVQWYKKSKKDGTITAEEIDEAVQIANATKEEVENVQPK